MRPRIEPPHCPDGGAPHRARLAGLSRRVGPAAVSAIVLGWLAVTAVTALAQDAPQKIEVDLARSYLLDLRQKVETVSITDTDIADFVVAADTQVLIHGKKVGTTSLVVWVTGGFHRRYDLTVRRGFAPSQILLDVRVAELTNSSDLEFGVDYLVQRLRAANNDRSVGLYTGKIGKPGIPLSAGSFPEYADDAELVLRYIENDLRYEAIIHAMEQEGLLKVLAKPTLVCIDGEEASFLAGGEIPIPVAQTSSIGGTTVTVEWREFGVRLNFTPALVDSNLINLKVEPEVSSLDFNNSVVIGGFVVPALQTRKVATRVEMHDGQSLIIGGLKATTVRDIRRKIPILGSIPVLGWLFSDTQKTSEENDLLVIVSPKIVSPTDVAPVVPWEQSSSH